MRELSLMLGNNTLLKGKKQLINDNDDVGNVE